MDDLPDATIKYAHLPEEGHLQLHHLRDQLSLLVLLTTPATREEEMDAPLQLPRTMLAQCFQQCVDQLDDVLDTFVWPPQTAHKKGEKEKQARAAP